MTSFCCRRPLTEINTSLESAWSTKLISVGFSSNRVQLDELDQVIVGAARSVNRFLQPEIFVPCRYVYKRNVDLIHHGVQEAFGPVNDNGPDEVWVNSFSKIEFVSYSSSLSTILIVSCSSKRWS